ncbi:amidohydrolase/deacetylase family metallohydrolase [soil metagenome]
MTSVALVGGSVFDPDAGGFEPKDLWVVDGRIAAAPASGAAGESAHETIDVSGLIVSPGLVDLHTHVFHGQDLGLVPDEIAARSGTTTLIDAGSAGGHLFGAFRLASVDRAETRIRAFVNIASVGTTSIMLGGELKALYYSDEDVAAACVEANRDIVVGVKVRASGDVGGENSPEALRRARRVADRVGLPLMVHLGPAPASVDEILDTLREGDIMTHSFTGWEGNRVVENGELRASVRAARDRGVLLDIGHGGSGFSSLVARAMVEMGEPPDTISSDLHVYSQPTIIDLPTVLSKFLSFGMPLADVLARTTLAPARAVGLDSLGVGTLRPGAPGDIAVFRIDEGEVEFGDGFGARFTGTQTLTPVLTLRDGVVVYREDPL